MKSSDKQGCIFVTVKDTENFIEIEIVELEIVKVESGLSFELRPLFD